MSEALIVVDMQRGFVNDRSAHVVAPIARFLQDWLDGGRMAIFTRFVNPVGSKWEMLLHWTRVREHPEIDLVPEVEALVAPYLTSGQVVVLDKASYSSLTPEVAALIARHGATDVYVCGIATDGCVLATALDIFASPSLTPFVLADLCASDAGEALHDAGLVVISRCIGSTQVVHSGTEGCVAPKAGR